MGNKRINLGDSLTSKYTKLIGIPLLTITSIFLVLIAVGFEISGSDDYCLGTPEDPCISYGKICNPTPDNYDIYNPDEIKLDFFPEIQNYWIFFKDGRVKKEMLYALGVNASTAGWRYENFTNATKPREDRIYVHRFAAYTCQDYMLIGLKNNPNEKIKWGFGISNEYLDPFWYSISGPPITQFTNISLELGSQINITTNLTGADTVCVDIDHPEYGEQYSCGSPNANFLFNISYFRKTEMNDSSETANLTFVSSGNETFWIQGHQYDEMINASLNLTGYNYSNVNVYINGSLSNSVGELSDGIISLYTFGGGYSLYGNLVNGTTGALDAGDCLVPGCAEFWDGNWETYATLDGGDNANITVNYTIPSYRIDSGEINFIIQASETNDLKLYCKDDGIWITTTTLSGTGYYQNYTFDLPETCFDDENILEVKYVFYPNSYIGESEITWYEEAKIVSFSTPGVETFTINISSDANVTSATFNISSVLYENVLDQESITTKKSYLVGDQATVAWSQRFKPGYANLSRVAVYIDKTFFTNIGNLNVWVGTTANSSNIGSGVITYNSVGTTPDWELISLDTDLIVGNTYYITLSGPVQVISGYNYGYRWYYSGLEEGVYDDGGITMYLLGSPINFTGDFAFRTYIDDLPENITLEIGDVDGTYEWNYTGEFTIEEQSDDFSEELNNYLENCTTTAGYCLIPVYAFSKTPGSLIFTNVKINYTSNPNPIYLNIDLISKFLNHSSGFANIPITIESDRACIIGVSDIKLDYAGGNETIEIFAYESVLFNWTDLISYYKLDESSGTVLDATGNGLTGTSYNATRGVSGILNTAYYFNKSDSNYINITANVKLRPSNLTFNVWFKTICNYDVGGGGEYLVNFHSSSTTYGYFGGMRLGSNSTGGNYCSSLYVMLYNATGSPIDVIGTSQNNNDNNWHMATVTFNGTNLSLYKDGVLENSKVVPLTSINWSNQDLSIGRLVGQAEKYYFNGTMDEISIWNRSLSADEIGAIYDNKIGYMENIINYSNNETLNLINYYSNWNYEFPNFINYLEFIPRSATAKNVTPYGQSSSNPIFNITNYGYGGIESNFSVYLNETYSCVNLTLSTTNNKSDGFLLNATWKDYVTNFDYLETQGLWMWADYGCNYTTWKLWEPDLSFRNCCESCTCSGGLI